MSGILHISKQQVSKALCVVIEHNVTITKCKIEGLQYELLL